MARRTKSAPPSIPIGSLSDVLQFARSFQKNETDLRGQKKNFAEGFSRAMATLVAAALRKHFAGITPDDQGRRQEAPARTSKGFKKLDVNYSTPELGLALGVSLKSIHARTAGSGYRRNFTRNENELRAEAMDYHERQPFAVLVAVLFLPIDACDDRTKGRPGDPPHSSFAAAVRFFRERTGRRWSKDALDLFEGFFVGLYDEATGTMVFFDVAESPPKLRRPTSSEVLTLSELVERIRGLYDQRNVRLFEWRE